MKLPKLQPVDINKKTKKKILLLSDDFRLPSGIGTISREIILKTVHHYDWVQLGAALNHPEHGKGQDVSQQIQQETGIMDADVKVIPWTGYGDRNVLFSILNQEKPDAILHFTDPRYWGWLYALEHEIKTTYGIPIAYYSIWDDLPYPMWNAPFYGSCDMIMGISKQSDNIHREVLKQNGFEVYDHDSKEKDNGGIITGYVPHGLDENVYTPLDRNKPEYRNMHKQIKEDNGADFVVFWNNRNARRKQSGTLLWWWSEWIDKRNLSGKAQLIMHTNPYDAHGQNLNHIATELGMTNREVVFSTKKLALETIPLLYTSADCTINIADAEGFGLATLESLSCGTPIIVNMTGGLQEQIMGIDGPFGFPIYPTSKSIIGSQQVPYIYEDRISKEQVFSALDKMYALSKEDRHELGLNGSEHVKNNYNFEFFFF